MVDKVTKFMEGKEFAGFQAKAGAAFGSLFANIGDFATKLYENRAQIMDFATKTVNVLTDVGNAVKNVAVFFVNNWSTIKPIIIGVTAAVVAFKVAAMTLTVITTLSTLFTTLGTVITTVRGAMLFLNVPCWQTGPLS